MSTMDPPEERRAGVDPAAAVLREAAEAVDPLDQKVEMTPLDFPRRLLLVHAHPDDESISCGATMAKYAAEGALVTLVTCTLVRRGRSSSPSSRTSRRTRTTPSALGASTSSPRPAKPSACTTTASSAARAAGATPG